MNRMLAASRTARVLAAVLAALWTPVCLCHGGAGSAQAHGADHGQDHGPQHGDHHHGPPGHDHPHPAPPAPDHGPCDHQGGEACDCLKLVSTPLNPGPSMLKSLLATPVAPVCSLLADALLSPARAAVSPRHTRVHDGLDSSLLRLHCALTV